MDQLHAERGDGVGLAGRRARLERLAAPTARRLKVAASTDKPDSYSSRSQAIDGSGTEAASVLIVARPDSTCERSPASTPTMHAPDGRPEAQPRVIQTLRELDQLVD